MKNSFFKMVLPIVVASFHCCFVTARSTSSSTAPYLPAPNLNYKYSTDSIHTINNRYEPNALCRVSALLNTSFDQLSSYPLDIFSTYTLPEIKRHKETNNCSSWRSDKASNPLHICSSAAKVCPLRHSMLKEALSRSDSWLKGSPHALCNLQAYMLSIRMQNFPIKVIILGGSLTYGADGEGCHTISPTMKCGWSFYLAMWLQYIGRGSITAYNFAIGGATRYNLNSHHSHFPNGLVISSASICLPCWTLIWMRQGCTLSLGMISFYWTTQLMMLSACFVPRRMFFTTRLVSCLNC